MYVSVLKLLFYCPLSILMPSVKFLGGKSSAGANLPLVLSLLQWLVFFLLGVFPERCIFQWTPPPTPPKTPAWDRLFCSVLGREEHVLVPVCTEAAGLLPWCLLSELSRLHFELWQFWQLLNSVLRSMYLPLLKALAIRVRTSSLGIKGLSVGGKELLGNRCFGFESSWPMHVIRRAILVLDVK